MEEPETILLQLEAIEAREKELIKKIDDLNDFIENAALPLHWVNGSGIITWANQVELDLLGYSKEEYVGKHISAFHADKEVIEEILHRLINKQTLINYPARLLTKNGEIKHVLINSNVLWDGDTFVRTRCFTRDITDLKKAEEEKDRKIKKLEDENKKLSLELNKLRGK